MQEYVDNLCKEINLYYQSADFQAVKSNYSSKIPINSLYLGGGTPSLLSPEQLNQILQSLAQYFDINQSTEFSFESNPGSIERMKLQEFVALGVNRISIGVQSFVKKELGFLKRSHSPQKAIKAIEDAHSTGINNINLDLIFAIPGQTFETWEYSLRQALDLDTQHISTYSLIYEEGTKLYQWWQSGKAEKCSEEFDSDLYLYTIDKTKELGFEQYEVSNFAKDGKLCKHNHHAWQSGEYFAFGVSSYGYINGTRYNNFRDLDKYNSALASNQLAVESKEILSENQIKAEAIFLPLRADGIDLANYKDRYHLDLAAIWEKEIEQMLNSEMIAIHNNKLILRGKGYAICDAITIKLLSKAEEFFGE